MKADSKIRMNFVQCLWLVIITGSFLLGAKAIGASEEWLERRMLEVENSAHLSIEKRIEVLAGAVRAGNLSPGESLPENRRILSSTAVDLLVAIPGHAEHFGKPVIGRLRHIQKLYEEGKTDAARGAMFGYSMAISDMKQVLQNLPSRETVKVLGEMLNETWLSPDEFDDQQPGPLSRSAVSTLSKLPIANPPTPPLLYSEQITQGLEAWQIWYAEVEAGRRTFRFIGDDTEYDLRGPVRRGGFERTDRSKKNRDLSADQSQEPVSFSKPESETFLPYVLALLFLAGGGWYFLRKYAA